MKSSESLSFTLEHYDTLQERNKKLFSNSLRGLPLIVLGYSGNDTDVLPVLDEISKDIPKVIVIMHPGSPKNQPILKVVAEKKIGVQ